MVHMPLAMLCASTTNLQIYAFIGTTTLVHPIRLALFPKTHLVPIPATLPALWCPLRCRQSRASAAQGGEGAAQKFKAWLHSAA